MWREELSRLPRPLLLSLALASAEGLFFLGYAALEVLFTATERLVMSATTGAFFAAYGAALLVCCWGATRRLPWARSPIVLAQLIQIAVAWGFVGGQTTPVAVTLIVLAAVVIVGMLLPSSTAVLVGGEDSGGTRGDPMGSGSAEQ